MNRVKRAWKAIGKGRQIAAIVIGASAVTQVVLLIAAGWLALLPTLIALVAMAAVLIKASASTRDTMHKVEAATRRLAKIEGAVSGLRSQRTFDPLRGASEPLGLVREQVGRVSAQFDWLAERALELEGGIARVASQIDIVVDRTAQHAAAIQRLHAEISATKAGVDSTIAHVAKATENVVGNTRALATDIAAVSDQVARAFDGGNSHGIERRLTGEISALNLLHRMAAHPSLPVFDGWAMSPLSVWYVQSIARRLGPGMTVVELGSGVSTAWIASALSGMPESPRLVAIDHDPRYGEITRQYLSDLDLQPSTSADVVIAPLRALDLDGAVYRWYDTTWISEVERIGLLIVDGPPSGEDVTSRYPALPLLLDRLADEAIILLDDADRPGEADTMARWLKIPGITRGEAVGRSRSLRFSRAGGAT